MNLKEDAALWIFRLVALLFVAKAAVSFPPTWVDALLAITALILMPSGKEESRSVSQEMLTQEIGNLSERVKKLEELHSIIQKQSEETQSLLSKANIVAAFTPKRRGESA